jgi:hypothetical protein
MVDEWMSITDVHQENRTLLESLELASLVTLAL